MTKILISAGEPSGDLHASRLVEEIKKILPDTEFTGLGGHRMEKSGVKLLYSIEDLDIVGFQEAILKYRKINEILKNLVRASRDGITHAIFVDYPGFNLKLASKLKPAGIKTFYYIVPQVWAWGRWRVGLLKKYIDKAIVILPFEESFLKNYGIDATYVGHPIVDIVNEDRDEIERENGKVHIALLPGSRKDEIRRLLSRMIEIKRHIEKRIPDSVFLLSLLLDEVPDDLKRESNLKIYHGRARAVIKASDFVIVASGTASLEAGLLGKPMVVLYMLGEISWILANLIARVPYASLVNLLLGKEVVPEVLQHIDPERVANEVVETLKNREKYNKIKRELQKLPGILKGGGAARRAAEIIAKEIGR